MEEKHLTDALFILLLSLFAIEHIIRHGLASNIFQSGYRLFMKWHCQVFSASWNPHCKHHLTGGNRLPISGSNWPESNFTIEITLLPTLGNG